MYQAPEQMVALNKANFDTMARLAGIALASVERLIEAQMKAVKISFAKSAQQAKSLVKARDFEELTQHTRLFAQSRPEQTSTYITNICEIAATTQSEIGELLEQQAVELHNHYMASHDQMMNWLPTWAEAAGSTFRTAAWPGAPVCNISSTSAGKAADTTHANREVAPLEGASGGKKRSA